MKFPDIVKTLDADRERLFQEAFYGGPIIPEKWYAWDNVTMPQPQPFTQTPQQPLNKFTNEDVELLKRIMLGKVKVKEPPKPPKSEEDELREIIDSAVKDLS